MLGPLVFNGPVLLILKVLTIFPETEIMPKVSGLGIYIYTP